MTLLPQTQLMNLVQSFDDNTPEAVRAKAQTMYRLEQESIWNFSEAKALKWIDLIHAEMPHEITAESDEVGSW